MESQSPLSKTGFSNTFLYRGVFTLYNILFSLISWASTVDPDRGLYYLATGTGRTTGHIATLTISNPGLTTIQTTIGDCLIPAERGYQAYVIPETYSIIVKPFESVNIKLSGYCANVYSPAIPDGERMPSVSKWITWHAAPAIPNQGSSLPPEFNKSIADSIHSSFTPTYPGSNTAFPYQIDFSKHPDKVTRLLLHYVYATGISFDRLIAKGEIINTSRDPLEFRQSIIQNAIWAYAGNLEGKIYNQQNFSKQFIEDAEQQRNQKQDNIPSDEKLKIKTEADDLWNYISLTGEEAKLIPVNENHTSDLFRETKIGQTTDPDHALSELFKEDSNATSKDEQIYLTAALFLRENDIASLNDVKLYANKSWNDYLLKEINSINTQSENDLPKILSLFTLLETESGNILSQNERSKLTTHLVDSLNRFIQFNVSILQQNDKSFLLKWRTLHHWKYTPWYQEHCITENPLKELVSFNTHQLIRNTDTRSGYISLTGILWKDKPEDLPVVANKKFPWWIPAVGLPIIGGITYLIFDGDDQPDDTIPTDQFPIARPDIFSLPCGSSNTFNALSNDRGEGIIITNVSGASGINISNSPSGIIISSIGAGNYRATYTITDIHGKTSTSTISIMVIDQTPPSINCPPNLRLKCGQNPDTALTGNAIATDDCPPMPGLTFIDEITGTPCDQTIKRMWLAKDASSKTATCTQLIEIKDGEPPQITSCPPSITVSIGQQNDLNITGQLIATDICNPQHVLKNHADDLSGFGNCGGLIIRNWTATDDCKNSSTCNQSILVQDQSIPQITCPSDITVQCGRQYQLSTTGTAVASDACSGSITPVYTDNPISLEACSGTINRTWTANDSSGNSVSCVQHISVIDTELPVFTSIAPNIDVQSGQQNNLSITGKPQAIDSCRPPAIDPVFTDDLSNFGICYGTILRTWTATDECGNTIAYKQTINVSDKTSPDINCPSNISVSCNQKDKLNVTGSATAMDNCSDTISITYKDSLMNFNGCTGTIMRSWTAKDLSGNTDTCTQHIQIKDEASPVFTFCPPAVTISCGKQNNLDITGEAQVIDSCSGSVTLTFTDDLRQFKECKGLITRTFLATDACGNTSTCRQAITVLNTPCGFNPNFSVTNALCDRCIGAVSSNITPPGSYNFEWGDGSTGTGLTELCQGSVVVTITDQNNECANFFTVVVGNTPMLTLTVLQVVRPSSPSASDGSITLRVTPPAAETPFLVFVNGVPTFSAINHTFTYSGLFGGEYLIWVVDQQGQGCISNDVFVLLIPRSQTDDICHPGIELQTTNPPQFNSPQISEHWNRIISNSFPEKSDVQIAYHWKPLFRSVYTLPVSHLKELRFEASLSNGIALIRNKSISSTEENLNANIQSTNFTAGLRQYYPIKNPKGIFYSDFQLSRIDIGLKSGYSNSLNLLSIPNLSDSYYQFSVGGGLRYALLPSLVFDVTARMNFQFLDENLKMQPGVFGRIIIPIKLPNPISTFSPEQIQIND